LYCIYNIYIHVINLQDIAGINYIIPAYWLRFTNTMLHCILTTIYDNYARTIAIASCFRTRDQRLRYNKFPQFGVGWLAVASDFVGVIVGIQCVDFWWRSFLYTIKFPTSWVKNTVVWVCSILTVLWNANKSNSYTK
jgi:hypothetical protein